jgi:hypothetical protein
VPFVLAAVTVWGGPSVQQYAQNMAKIFMYGINVWAVGKVTQGASAPIPAPTTTTTTTGGEGAQNG